LLISLEDAENTAARTIVIDGSDYTAGSAIEIDTQNTDECRISFRAILERPRRRRGPFKTKPPPGRPGGGQSRG
jgi:hypothetical protein